MNPPTRLHAAGGMLLALTCVVILSASSVYAQATVPPATDTAALARYDQNRNGVLDANERALQQRDEARAASAAPETAAKEQDEIVELSPFQVTGAGDRGYYAANTMSSV